MNPNLEGPSSEASPNDDATEPGAAIPLGGAAAPSESADSRESDNHEPPNEDCEEDAALESAELEDWKQELRRDFETWLETVDSIPSTELEETPYTPDLLDFYRDFAASSAEARKSNRRTAEAFSQWGDTLSRFDTELRSLREQLSRQPAAPVDSLPRPWCLALVELLDRLQRLATAFKSTPPSRWWFQDSVWRQAWAGQQQALLILIGHAESLLAKAGVTRIRTVGESFDPTTMAATATESSSTRPHQSVIDELSAGYRLRNELLRVADVKVSIRPN